MIIIILTLNTDIMNKITYQEQITKGFDLTKAECAAIALSIGEIIKRDNLNPLVVARNLKAMEEIVSLAKKQVTLLATKKMVESEENSIYIQGTRITLTNKAVYSYSNSPAIVSYEQKIKTLTERLKELKKLAQDTSEPIKTAEGLIHPAEKDINQTISVTLVKE